MCVAYNHGSAHTVVGTDSRGDQYGFLAPFARPLAVRLNLNNFTLSHVRTFDPTFISRSLRGYYGGFECEHDLQLAHI
jgi:hypothetical protein